MKYFFISLIVLGGMFSAAARGNTGDQRRIYKWIAIAIWILTFILANTIL